MSKAKLNRKPCFFLGLVVYGSPKALENLVDDINNQPLVDLIFQTLSPNYVYIVDKKPKGLVTRKDPRKESKEDA